MAPVYSSGHACYLGADSGVTGGSVGAAVVGILNITVSVIDYAVVNSRAGIGHIVNGIIRADHGAYSGACVGKHVAVIVGGIVSAAAECQCKDDSQHKNCCNSFHRNPP